MLLSKKKINIALLVLIKKLKKYLSSKYKIVLDYNAL